MSHLSRIFEEAPIKVQNRNGFDLSHVHSGTSKAGQLVPVLTKLIAPNSTISLGVNAEVNLPPLVAPFYGKVDFAIEGFIVPCSILYGGWKQFISNQEATQFPVSQAALNSTGDMIVNGATTTSGRGVTGFPNRKGYELPYIDFFQILTSNIANFVSLNGTNDNIYSYMGCNPSALGSVVSTSGFNVSLLPALAYHKICDTFYRNTKLTRTWFAVNPNAGLSTTSGINVSSSEAAALALNTRNVSLIWHSFYTSDADAIGRELNTSTDTMSNTSARFGTAASLTFPDGVSVFSTRQRTYMRDYFTSAVPSPQQGGSAQLSFDTSTSTSEFTINALRTANALQKFLETNNLSGDYADMMRNRWGIRPIDADFEEPHYLGRVVIPVYQHTIYKSDTYYPEGGSAVSENPFVADGSLGASASVAKANGEGSICDNFNVSCWSYLMCIASLYPHANYNYGLNRELTTLSIGDFPAPELQTIGMEEIKNYEIGPITALSSYNSTFGYTQRYSRFKYMDDRASGELAPGKTLSQFQLQRIFPTNAAPQLGTDFVTIPQNALDNVLTVSTATQKFTCWWEIYFNFKVVMPLADYCIPTLGDLQDTHTIKATQGGSRL